MTCHLRCLAVVLLLALTGCQGLESSWTDKGRSMPPVEEPPVTTGVASTLGGASLAENGVPGMVNGVRNSGAAMQEFSSPPSQGRMLLRTGSIQLGPGVGQNLWGWQGDGLGGF